MIWLHLEERNILTQAKISLSPTLLTILLALWVMYMKWITLFVISIRQRCVIAGYSTWRQCYLPHKHLIFPLVTTVTDNRSQPSELSYVSTTGGGSNRYQEGRESPSDCLTGNPPGSVPPPRPPLPRCQSERPSTLRIERTPLLKSYSERGCAPIKSGTL